MFRWVLVALAGCGPKLGGLQVSYGLPEPMPIVQPSTDVRRWYVPMDTSTLGPVVWFVDTGYTYSTCDDDLVEALGLSAHGVVQVRGELGTLEAQKVVLPRIELGGHELEDLVCIVRDLGSTSSLDDPGEVPIAGVIGMDVLRRFRVRVDPTLGEITLSDPAGEAPLRAGDDGVFPLRRKGLRARVALDVGGKTIWPILDTGASHTYVDGERLGLQASAVAENVTVRGTGATGAELRSVVSYEVDTVRVGSWSVPATTFTGRDRRWREPGLLGLDLLSRFEQDYDFASGRARLVPASATELPQFAAWWARPRPIPAKLFDEEHAVRQAVLAVGDAADAEVQR